MGIFQKQKCTKICSISYQIHFATTLPKYFFYFLSQQRCVRTGENDNDNDADTSQKVNNLEDLRRTEKKRSVLKSLGNPF